MTEQFIANFNMQQRQQMQAVFKMFPDFVTLDTEQTITNKTIDADDNTITDLKLDNFKTGVVQTAVRAAATASDAAVATEKAVRELVDSTAESIVADVALPKGMIVAYGGTVVPEGWLVCDGSAVDRTTYSKLFSAIGDTFGVGDGETTFNLPDFRNKTFWGGDSTNVGTVKSAGLPNIKGTFNGGDGANNNYSGAFTKTGTTTPGNASEGSDNMWSFNAANGATTSGIYSDSVTTVQPPAIQTMFIIKY